MSPFVLSVLKYSLLVLLYFFIYRAVRSVAVDVSGRRGGRSTEPTRTASVSAPARASRGGRPPSSVVVHEPDGTRPRTVRLNGTVDIGRSEACAIRLQDTYVSQMHARLEGPDPDRKDGGWVVEDLGSTNGTYLNDRRVVAPTGVHAGDVLRVGKTVLELRR